MIQCVHVVILSGSERDKDCLKIWESLKDAFIYKNPCNITPEDYQPLMELARHPIPCNKTLYLISQSLFWSKTNDLVHRYTKSNQNFLTLEDTLLGYMADRVSWCGDPSAPGNLHLSTILFTSFSSDLI
ncbi:hypothetical protein EK904_014322 [Melospiza melodia maxima]|nr:hypothetical protein EK904_014322 [Melospiza melodia maxima]